MITYELAKQLKDAGFPQEKKDGVILTPITQEVFGKSPVVEGEPSYSPSLSELIEAGGERFMSVNKNFFPRPEKYFASSKDGGGMNRFGSTPKEAVAKLYLALKGVV